MADPFEVRLRFTNLLTHLSASTTSSLKTAAYALKHRDMDEDLHSCIIENLERPPGTGADGKPTNPTTQVAANNNNGSNINTPASAAALMNNRANIMYFLEHFCEMAIREKHEAYVDFVRRDIGRIVDSVAASGANVKVVRRVVGTLGEKGYLSEELVGRVEENLREKEKERGALLDEDGGEGTGHDVEMGDVSGAGGSEVEVGAGGLASRRSVTDGLRSVPRSGRDARPNGVSKADKKAIEQRIEEDRERNKRLREGVWAVSGDDENELEKMWEEGSDLSENDYIIGLEEAEERRQFARYHQNLLQR